MSAIAARAAALLLTSEKGRKGVGFLLIAIFAPVILIAADSRQHWKQEPFSHPCTQ